MQLGNMLRNLAGIAFLSLFFIAALNDDDPVGSTLFLVIVFGAIFATSVKAPKPQGIDDSRTHRDIRLPSYVENAMTGRWFVLILGGLLTAVTKSALLWGLTVAGFILLTDYASRKYYHENPVEWEIAFHNDVDGYHNGDGDGDGD
ncbi:hypothetical protein [Yoonia sp. 2307UL14-13]|uniref:hypothetical protein n=1 Tax=Yoonia sp. 2307UL14-13 TaxID=3126506 RepID=UPI00309F4826